MKNQFQSKCSGQKKKVYFVRWLELSQASGVVYASTPEDAIRRARHNLPIEEGYVEEYFGRAHPDSYECFNFDDVSPSGVDEYYTQLLLRTLQRSLGNSVVASELNPTSKLISGKGGATT